MQCNDESRKRHSRRPQIYFPLGEGEVICNQKSFKPSNEYFKATLSKEQLHNAGPLRFSLSACVEELGRTQMNEL